MHTCLPSAILACEEQVLEDAIEHISLCMQNMYTLSPIDLDCRHCHVWALMQHA